MTERIALIWTTVPFEVGLAVGFLSGFVFGLVLHLMDKRR